MVFDTVFSGGPILGSVNEFIDYAQFVVLLLIIYYVIRLFTVGGKSQEERDAEGTAFMDWVKEKSEGRKRKAEEAAAKEKREKEISICRGLLNPAKGFVIRAEQKVEEVVDESRTHSAVALHRIRTGIDQIEHNFHSARRALRASRIREKADRREYIGRLEAYVDSLQNILDTWTKPHIPTSDTDTTWTTKISELRNSLAEVKGGCGHLLRSMDKFMDDCSVQDPTAVGRRPSPGPSASPGRRP